ncbi:ferric reductase-like transmembrane domain-containing protein [Promicromonospora sp. Populi]|uniref:ferredoxin reductase family protein n=1 Tax=Promicromonospora sp. Populi TaxID=3239420 RepID=UPI0034E1E6D8
MTDQVFSSELIRPTSSPPLERSPYRPGWGDVLGVIAVLTTVAPVALWLRNHGLPWPLGMKSTVGMLGLLCSLVATQLMLLLVVLMARIPWVERAWGHDLLARRHRWIGFASFWFMMGHVVATSVDRISRDWSTAWQNLYDLFIIEPWMSWATIGTVLILAAMVTSIRRARRRLRYESWHLVHLYTYLGLVLILPHILVTGPEFHDAWPRVYLWTEYVLAGAAIVVFRFGLPLFRSWRHRIVVDGVRHEIPGVVSVSLTGRYLDKLGAVSGQFFIWRFLDGPGWLRGHPYALSAAPTDQGMRITIRASGDGSARAAELRPGTRVLIEGPYGTLTARERRWPRMLLLAAGVGITPLRALVEDTQYLPGEATVVYRYGDEEHALFRSELEELARERGFELVLLPGPRRSDGSWLPAAPGPAPEGSNPDERDERDERDELAVLLDAAPDVVYRDVFVCGPTPWVAAVRATLRRVGVRSDDIHSEVFAW